MSRRGKWIFVSLVCGLVCALAPAWSTRRTQAAPASTTLHGAAAWQQLEAEGNYAALTAALRAAVEPLITQERRLTPNDATARQEFGTAVALDGDTAVVGMPQSGKGGAPGVVYVFARAGDNQWAQQQKLTAHDGTLGDQFGVALALSGDTLVVGARGYDHGDQQDQGAAYVFTRSGGVWREAQALTARDGASDDSFGCAVALSGDTLALGAYGDDVGAGVNQGSAYIFTRGPNGWTQQQRLVAALGATHDSFGAALALSGDTVVVTALQDDVNGKRDQGSAYVFTRSGTVWAQQQQLFGNNGEADDYFGSAVALSGDTVAIGVSGDNFDTNIRRDQGSVVVFTRADGRWVIEQQLWAANGDGGDAFGQSVALRGDTLVVGAPGRNIGTQPDQGAAYVFARKGTLWAPQRQLDPTGERALPEAFFGVAVALSGDAVLASAPYESAAFERQGAVYSFTLRENRFAELPPVFAPDGAAGESFGDKVALNADTLAVGVASAKVGAQALQGAVYLFTRHGAGWAFQQKLTAPDGAAGDYFGGALALTGATLAVGVYGDSTDTVKNHGAVYVYARQGAQWQFQQKLLAQDGASQDLFGTAVALSGDTVAVGVHKKRLNANAEQGALYLYTRGNGAWAFQQKLFAPDGAALDHFGYSVALSGDTVVAGAPDDDLAFEGQGTAYVFTRSGGTWFFEQKLLANDPTLGARLGYAVALDGDTVALGTPSADVPNRPRNGAVYVFTRRVTLWTLQQKVFGTPTSSLGWSVALAGDTLVAGAPSDGVTGMYGLGAAFVFARGGASWRQQQKLSARDAKEEDELGTAVAFNGDTVVAGTPNSSRGGQFAQGAAYLFASPACATITLTPATLSPGQINQLYRQSVTASGGTGPYQFALSEGALPPGVTLAQNGTLEGRPTAVGVFRFTITATQTDSLCNGSQPYTVTVTAGGCDYQTAPAQQTFPAEGGNGEARVAVSSSCAWTATSNAPWLRITANQSGTGSRAILFNVEPNVEAVTRRAAINIAGSTVTVVQSSPLAAVSAASFSLGAQASESIIAAFGGELAATTQAATATPLPMTLAGVRLSVRDSQGTERFAPLFFVSPTQINFQMPPGTATGKAQLTVLRDSAPAANGSVNVLPVVPGLFSASANGQGLALGVALRIKADGAQSYEEVTRYDAAQRRHVAVPINLGPAGERVVLVLFATGLRQRSTLGAVSVKLGGVTAETLFAGPQGALVGLDQLNVLLPRTLSGRGEVDINVTVDGLTANPLKVAIR